MPLIVRLKLAKLLQVSNESLLPISSPRATSAKHSVPMNWPPCRLNLPQTDA